MQPRPDTWEDKALAAFWASEFKDETLDSHARIRAAVSAAALFLIHTYSDHITGNVSHDSSAHQHQCDGRLHGQHRQDPDDDAGGGDSPRQAGQTDDGAA